MVAQALRYGRGSGDRILSPHRAGTGDASRVVSTRPRDTCSAHAMGVAIGGGDDELYFALGGTAQRWAVRSSSRRLLGASGIRRSPNRPEMIFGRASVRCWWRCLRPTPRRGQKLLLQRLGDPGLDETGISELQR